MNDTTIMKIAGICCLSAIGIAALLNGIDSVLIGTICAIIGGVLGYTLTRGEKKE